MPTVNDGQKGMVTKPTNETVVFAGNYEGPQYAPHPDLLKQQYDKDKYLPDTQQEPFIATYHD